MPVTKIGNALTTPEERQDSPEVTRSEAGDIITRSYNLKKSQAKTYTDGLSYGTADAEYTNSTLQEIGISSITGDTVLLRLIYRPEAYSYEILPPVGTVIQEVDANPIEIPITQSSASASEQEALRLDGVEAYLSPQPVYRRIEVLSSFTFSEANAIDDVGKIDNTPEGLSSPTAGKWLKTGQVVRSVGDKFEKTETWQYAANGWDTTLYSSVA